jgi:hypothetical protein
MSNPFTSAWLNQHLRVKEAKAVAFKVRITPVITPKAQTEEERLNKTEAAYLRYLRDMGFDPGIQRITFKLADDCRFTPDFDFFNPEGRWEFVDVKGFQREDALIKIKFAARILPHLTFSIVKRDGGGWNRKEVRV